MTPFNISAKDYPLSSDLLFSLTLSSRRRPTATITWAAHAAVDYVTCSWIHS